MMFATRRSLSDACNTVAKQLENVYSSIEVSKRHLSSRIDRVDCNLDECAELIAASKQEVSELQGDMKIIGVDVQCVHSAVRTLETKISRLEGKQDATNEGVGRLVYYVRSLENGRITEHIQAASSRSSTPALEMPQLTPSSRTESSSPVVSAEPPTPSTSNGPRKIQRPLQTVVSDSGFKELHGILDVADMSSSPDVSNGVQVTEDTSNGNSVSGLFRWMLGSSASVHTRTGSIKQSFKWTAM